MTGIRAILTITRISGDSTWININKIILIASTKNKKLVPQRLCCLELILTLSTVSGSPCSMQLMHLCSAPWYINVLWISSILEINAI